MSLNPESKSIRRNIESLGFSATLGMNEKVKKLREDGVTIYHLGFGESPFPVHPILEEALRQNAGKNSYLPAAGLPVLRRLAGDYFAEKFGFSGLGHKSVIGPGSKSLIFALQLSLDGDLLLPIPSWVSYNPQANLIGDKVVRIPTEISNSYHITAALLEETILDSHQAGRKPKKLILNYPNNPTGLSFDPSRLQEIAEVCRRHRIVVISDEIYGLVHHRSEHISIARFYPEGTIVTSGLSKHLSLGGYRIGIAMIPKKLESIFGAVVRIASETWSSVPAPIQYAVIKAFLNNADIESYITDCVKVHSIVSNYFRQVLLDVGIDYPPLDGGFYLYPDFSPFRQRLAARGIHTSVEFAGALLDEVRIASLPGTVFGDQPERLTLRLALCDYDGKTAIDYYRKNPSCTAESLINDCCSNINQAGVLFNKFMCS